MNSCLASRIIAIDPGKTSGVAILTEPFNIKSLAQYTDFKWISDLEIKSFDTVIWEHYFISGQYFDASGIEIIGALKLICEKVNCNYIVQHPFIPTFINVRFGLHNIKFPCSIHAKEALFHGIYYLRNNINKENIINEIKRYSSD